MKTIIDDYNKKNKKGKLTRFVQAFAGEFKPINKEPKQDLTAEDYGRKTAEYVKGVGSTAKRGLSNFAQNYAEDKRKEEKQKRKNKGKGGNPYFRDDNPWF